MKDRLTAMARSYSSEDSGSPSLRGASNTIHPCHLPMLFLIRTTRCTQPYEPYAEAEGTAVSPSPAKSVGRLSVERGVNIKIGALLGGTPPPFGRPSLGSRDISTPEPGASSAAGQLSHVTITNIFLFLLLFSTIYVVC